MPYCCCMQQLPHTIPHPASSRGMGATAKTIIHARINPELALQFHDQAREQQISLTAAVEAAISDYVQKNSAAFQGGAAC